MSIVLEIGKTYNLNYRIEHGKVLVKREVTVVSEDNFFYYINTGILKSTPILKSDVIDILF